MNNTVFKILVAIFCLWALSSCSSSKKLKASTKQQTEVITTVKEQKTDVSTVETVDISDKDSTWSDEENISITFAEGSEDGEIITDEPELDIFLERENDYEAAEPKKPVKPAPKKPVYTYNINGNDISTTQPIKKVELQNKKTGKTRELDVKTTNAKDSGTATTTANKKEQTNTDTKTKDTSRKTPAAGALLLALLIGILAFGLYLWKRMRPRLP